MTSSKTLGNSRYVFLSTKNIFSILKGSFDLMEYERCNRTNHKSGYYETISSPEHEWIHLSGMQH